jgi:hypothetical protein
MLIRKRIRSSLGYKSGLVIPRRETSVIQKRPSGLINSKESGGGGGGALAPGRLSYAPNDFVSVGWDPLRFAFMSVGLSLFFVCV